MSETELRDEHRNDSEDGESEAVDRIRLTDIRIDRS